MVHLFMISNKLPTVGVLKECLCLWPDIIDTSNFGNGYMFGDIPRDTIKLSYFRIQEDTAKYAGKIFVAVRLDYDDFPKIDGYIEHRVLPQLGKVIGELEETFELNDGVRHDHFDENQNAQYALYRYDADTDAINSAMSEVQRELFINPVNTK